jgi:hypothetical protein
MLRFDLDVQQTHLRQAKKALIGMAVVVQAGIGFSSLLKCLKLHAVRMTMELYYKLSASLKISYFCPSMSCSAYLAY